MGSNVIPGYNPVVFLADETTLGTPVAPANVAAFAAQAIATIEDDVGDAQTPDTRAMQDRGLGRDMQVGFVSGRYPPVPWSVMTSMKTRADADDAPRELALWKAAGLGRTVNVGTSYVLAPTGTPVASSDFVPQTLQRILGRSPDEMMLDRLFGCLCDTVKIEGGDKEVMLGFSGFAQKKIQGTALASITITDVATAITVTAAESYAFPEEGGYYICESEIILVTAFTHGATSIPITRAALASSAVAHTAKPIYPYLPSGVAYSGAPVPESLTTNFVFAGDAFPVLKWGVTIKTGLAFTQHETGNAYAPRVKANRFDVDCSFDFLLKGDDVRKYNRARARTATACSLVQGTSAGGIITIGLPYSELKALPAKSNANDSITVSASLRVRGDTAGNNAFSITLT